MKRRLPPLAALLLALCSGNVPTALNAAAVGQENSISLAGTWRFQLDPENVGVEKKWFAMLRLDLQLATVARGQSFADQRAVSFGLRDFNRDKQRLTSNGRTVFLRGRLDCANYPLTGYPPMDKAGWLRVLGILKDWGLNHVRFHSWCPPEAAFEAADELGMYFQAEFPNKRSAFKAPESTDAPKRNIDYLDVPGSDPNASLYDYALREAELIFRHFGNHPSFVMFTLGNELGRNPAMFELVARFQKRDPRQLPAMARQTSARPV